MGVRLAGINAPEPIADLATRTQTALCLCLTGPFRFFPTLGFATTSMNTMSMKSRAFVAMLLAILLPAANAASVRSSAPDGAVDAMNRAIEAHMAEARIVGVGAAILVDKRVVWTQGYGFADREHGRAFTPDTAMNVGSISKTITGVALMRAVQDGTLSLDQDINRWLPFKVVNPHFPTQPITLRHLATHTSGIVDRESAYAGVYHFGRDSPQALGDFLARYFAPDGKDYSKENFLDARPGTHREYSNIAAALAGYVVEIAVGERLDDYTRRIIFDPLKMANTGWFLTDIEPDDQSTLYIAQGLPVPIQPYTMTTYPDGGLRTSVADLSRLFAALLDQGAYQGIRILDQASAAEMLRFQYDASNKPGNVNLSGEDSVNSGIFWATKYDVTRIGHNGADPGMVAMMLSNLSKDIGVIVFFNTEVADADGDAYGAIFDQLWARAEAIKKAGGARDD